MLLPNFLYRLTRFSPRWIAPGYLLLVALYSFIFAGNVFWTSSEFQFRTYRDGSEALVLGKVFADAEGLPTDRANLGFVTREIRDKSSDVLAVYARIDHPHAVVPVELSDTNWQHGMSTYAPTFLLARDAVATLGYASNEVAAGSRVRFPGGDIRTISKVDVDAQFLAVTYTGQRWNATGVTAAPVIALLNDGNFVFDPYKAQYGLQGVVFSRLYKVFSIFSTVRSMQWLCAVLCALVVVLLAREYNDAFGNYFGAVFLLTMAGSPWVVAVARSLYWVPALWFLPALIAMYLFRAGSAPALRMGLYAAYGAAIFLKSLTGYEYLSTIVVLSVAIFIIDPFSPTPRLGKAEAVRMVSALFACSILGFLLAFLMHASIRADTVWDGVKATLYTDAFKYTNLSHVAGGATRGTDTSLISLLGTYILGWGTPVLFGVGGKWLFLGLMLLAAAALGYQYAVADRARNRDAALLLVMLAAPLSWLVLMKGHSVIHVHLNYVLWYLGCVPALLFVMLRTALLVTQRFKRSSPRLRTN